MPRPATTEAPARITSKQADCLRGVYDGLQVAEIAARLNISPRTVETHLKHARETLGASSSLAASRRAAEIFAWVREQPGGGRTRMPERPQAAALFSPSAADAIGEPSGQTQKRRTQVLMAILKRASEVVLYAGVLLAGLLLLLNALQHWVGRSPPHA